MDTNYKEIETKDGNKVISFDIRTKRGSCSGIFVDRIYVHHIAGNKCTKGIMQILINKFKTNKITFTPLINTNIENNIRGEVKWLDANDARNPYGEPVKYLECEWQT